MNHKLRDAWRRLILAEDYETHMATIGQAQSNADLVSDYFAGASLAHGAEVLFLGAGTGQMFDFVSPAFLAPYRTTFADINPAYLERLRQRLAPLRDFRFATVEDDVEQSNLEPAFDLVAAVLVLEHVDWRKAVATACRLSKARIFVITQQNPESLTSAMTPRREIPGTMNVFREIHPELIPLPVLRDEFHSRGFALTYTAEKSVADEKKMIASGFAKIS